MTMSACSPIAASSDKNALTNKALADAKLRQEEAAKVHNFSYNYEKDAKVCANKAGRPEASDELRIELSEKSHPELFKVIKKTGSVPLPLIGEANDATICVTYDAPEDEDTSGVSIKAKLDHAEGKAYNLTISMTSDPSTLAERARSYLTSMHLYITGDMKPLELPSN